MPLEKAVITRFDTILACYMAQTFGGADEYTWRTDHRWRTMCHQSAKVAARALHLLYPNERSEVLRVEMKAKMADSVRFVHLGWAEDPNIIEGKYPMHWAVRIGSGLYDPTFWQLSQCKTPLALPKTPFLYVPDFFRHAALPTGRDRDGFTWMGEVVNGQTLEVAYMAQPIPLPPAEQAKLLADGLAKRHAKRVADLFQKYKDKA